MDLILRITIASVDPSSDVSMARIWMAEQIHFFTGMAVTGFEDAVHPVTGFEIEALSYVDTE